MLPLHFDRKTTTLIECSTPLHLKDLTQMCLWDQITPECTVPTDFALCLAGPRLVSKIGASYPFQNNEIEKYTNDAEDKIVFLVPRTLHPILNRHFPSWVARNKKLRELSFSLADYGILRLGEVVQMTQAEVIYAISDDFPNDAKRRTELLEQKLTAVELRLGMRAPGWVSPGGLLSHDW
jgi:hypothetical protein